MRFSALCSLAAAIGSVTACDSCYGLTDEVVHERLARRMQLEAENALTRPKAPLEWGQLNVLHTTDTHGWLEGHLKERNFSADWWCDLPDETGLSDATSPNRVDTNLIFNEVNYDLLTIGNHELYVSEIAYERFYYFSRVWGDKYLTSNVQIINPTTGSFEYIGKQYRYFTTPQGLRIMAFGVLFDFGGSSNISKVTKAADVIKQQCLIDAVYYKKPIDLFLMVGHNPVRRSDPTSTFGFVHDTIRAMRPTIPIQIFSAHTHIRDFQVYSDTSTGIESGRYCETLGWLLMSGIKSKTYTGEVKPRGVPNLNRKATSTSKSNLVYSRRYMDWNRKTLEYHATNSQAKTFDTRKGLGVTGDITDDQKALNLSMLYGCAPITYCQSCFPWDIPGNIASLLQISLAAIVVNPSRSTIPRSVIISTGSIRFDLVKGPFTYDDSFIVSPYTDNFLFILNVPYDPILDGLNSAFFTAEQASEASRFGPLPQTKGSCVDPTISLVTSQAGELKGDIKGDFKKRALTQRYHSPPDSRHSWIPSYPQLNCVAANASFPTHGELATVDVVFVDYLADSVVAILNSLGGSYTSADVSYHMPPDFTTETYLPLYAQKYWQANVPNCPVGNGVGYSDKK
ncbi:hypothetical protein G7Y89_g499 [Cudoniella acicularis]|uniref:Calcineurin-like phosphoesterase domain-containing protein n=1 Tax=Cudoniella acicularis TaxID=354080 RepID=A0A8H4RY22_9HELO|nr:hypothetical protein G7Y89_g499 [Cudoniella acicularis]